MNLYLDDNSANPALVNLLRRAGHQVAVPADLGMTGSSDPRHLVSSALRMLVLIT